jgi:hypothetical protein
MKNHFPAMQPSTAVKIAGAGPAREEVTTTATKKVT